MHTMNKSLRMWLFALLALAMLATVGPVQRAVSQGMQHFTPLVGTEQYALQYPCTVSCYATSADIKSYVNGGASTTTGLVPTPLVMANMETVAGLQMTGSASSTNFGLTYTPGTGAYLVGTATSSGSTSNVASYDLVLPANYIAGSNITLSVGCYYLNGSSTASVHTMAAAAYLNTAAGAQGSTLIATAAQVCPITTSAVQTFVITGTTLVPGSYLTLTFSAAVTNAGGASTEYLTSASIK